MRTFSWLQLVFAWVFTFKKRERKKEHKLCTELESRGCVILKFCCLLRGQRQPAYRSFGLSCFCEENRITPKGALAARQTVIPTSSPAFPGHFLTSSSDRQGFLPQHFPICECHLKSFPTIPLPYGRAMGVVAANPYCQNQAGFFFFLILLLFWENLTAFPNRPLFVSRYNPIG